MPGHGWISLRSPNWFVASAVRCAIRLWLESDAVKGSRPRQIQHDAERHLAIAESFPGCFVGACGFTSLRCSWRDPVSRYSTKASQRCCLSAPRRKGIQIPSLYTSILILDRCSSIFVTGFRSNQFTETGKYRPALMFGQMDKEMLQSFSMASRIAPSGRRVTARYIVSGQGCPQKCE